MKSKTILLNLGAAAIFGLNAQAFANNNTLQAEKLDKGYSTNQSLHQDLIKLAEGKCGEGKCGEGKCGEGDGDAT